MEKLAFIRNPRVAVPYLLAAAVFAAVIGVAAAAVSTVGVASAGDARHVALAPTSIVPDAVAAPAKPRKLEAQRLDDGSVELSWRKPRGNAEIVGYKITYTAPYLDEPLTETYTSGFTETPITNDKGKVTGALVTLTKQVGGDASLRYRVRAYNDHFDGAQSREARVARIGKPAKIARRPSDDNARISVCWSKSAGEPTHYEIMRRLESEKASAIRVIATVADDGNDSDTWRQCHIDTGAAADTEYVYKVRGAQGSWKGKPSAALRASYAADNSNDPTD